MNERDLFPDDPIALAPEQTLGPDDFVLMACRHCDAWSWHSASSDPEFAVCGECHADGAPEEEGA